MTASRAQARTRTRNNFNTTNGMLTRNHRPTPTGLAARPLLLPINAAAGGGAREGPEGEGRGAGWQPEGRPPGAQGR